MQEKADPPIVVLIGVIQGVITIGLLWLFSVENLVVRIIYTLLVFLYSIYVGYRIYRKTYYIYNNILNDDFRLTWFNLLDSFTGYFLAWSLLLVLFWVWGQDNYFTMIGTWQSVGVFTVWQRFLHTSVLCGTGVGFGLYIPTQDASQFTITLLSYGAYVLALLTIGTGLSIVQTNISQRVAEGKEKRNSTTIASQFTSNPSVTELKFM